MDKTPIILIAIIIVLGIIGFQGFEKAERIECIKWQQEAMRFENVGWYPQEFQIQQCEQYNIILEK